MARSTQRFYELMTIRKEKNREKDGKEDDRESIIFTYILMIILHNTDLTEDSEKKY